METPSACRHALPASAAAPSHQPLPATKVDTAQSLEPKPRYNIITRRPGAAHPCKHSLTEPLHHPGYAKGPPARLQELG
jgi:hypothetical protein